MNRAPSRGDNRKVDGTARLFTRPASGADSPRQTRSFGLPAAILAHDYPLLFFRGQRRQPDGP